MKFYKSDYFLILQYFNLFLDSKENPHKNDSNQKELDYKNIVNLEEDNEENKDNGSYNFY